MLSFKFEKKYNFEFGFAPQDVWKSTSTKIEALKLLGVGRIIEAGIFSSQDDWVQAIVNQYYVTPEWFNLIGIPKAKQSLNSDGSLKKLSHVKTMTDRFLDYFGLECRESSKTKSNRSYAVSVQKKLWIISETLTNVSGIELTRLLRRCERYHSKKLGIKPLRRSSNNNEQGRCKPNLINKC